jgi:hypothetical protein
VSDLTKYYSRSLHLGYHRVSQAILQKYGLPSDCVPEVTKLAALWNTQAMRHLDTVVVRLLLLPAPFEGRETTVGPAKVQTSASYFWGAQIHQTWACIPKKHLKRTNV